MPRLRLQDPESAAEGTASAEPATTGRRPWSRGLRRYLLRAKRACRLCDVSLATWWRWDAAGKIPAGIKISGGARRWRRAELLAWVRAGCPDRRRWEAMKAADAGRSK